MSCNHPTHTHNVNNTQSPLLRLSREIRDEIWAYLVTLPHAIPLDVGTFWEKDCKVKVQVLGLAKYGRGTISSADLEGLSILRVCRQINTEASELLLSRNIWANYRALDFFADRLCYCKVAKIRHVQLSDDLIRPWDRVSEAIQRFSGLHYVVSELTTNTYASRAGVDDEYIAQQMEKRWTGYADAMNGSALERVYVRSDLDRLPLEDGTEGPITSILWDEKIVLTCAAGLSDGFNQEFLSGNGMELDIKKEIQYWQNWEQIDEEAYELEVEEAESQWAGNTAQDDRYVDSDGNIESDSDREWEGSNQSE